jgi:hypothetical protein
MNNIVTLKGQAYAGPPPAHEIREMLIETIYDFFLSQVCTYTPPLEFKEQVGDRIGILGDSELSIVELADVIVARLAGGRDE